MPPRSIVHLAAIESAARLHPLGRHSFYVKSSDPRSRALASALRRRLNMVKSTTDPNSKPPRLPSYVAIMNVVNGNIAVSASTLSPLSTMAKPPPADVALMAIARGPNAHNPTHTAKGVAATVFEPHVIRSAMKVAAIAISGRSPVSASASIPENDSALIAHNAMLGSQNVNPPAPAVPRKNDADFMLHVRQCSPNSRHHRARGVDSTQVKTADRVLRVHAMVLPFYSIAKFENISL